MKQRLLALLLCLLLVQSALLPARAQESREELLVEALKDFFVGAEGDYGAVNASDSGALSVGLLQWHGTRALELLKQLLERWPQGAELLSPALAAEIRQASDWSRRSLSAGEAARLSALLDSPQGRDIQEENARGDILGYLETCRSWGMASEETALYFAVILNQFGPGGAASYLRHIRSTLGLEEGAPISDLELLHRAVHDTKSYGQRYLNMRDKSYDYIKRLGLSASPEEAPLTDLPAPGSWARAGIDYVLERGLMRGLGDGRFGPEEALTRAMVVTILHRLAGAPAPTGAASFADVEPGRWYAAAVAWGQETGLARGLSPACFAPERDVTRQELGVFLHRWARLFGAECPSPGPDALADFADAQQVPAWAAEALSWCAEAGLFRGSPTEAGLLLDPKSTATRAQAAVLLTRFCVLLELEAPAD